MLMTGMKRYILMILLLTWLALSVAGQVKEKVDSFPQPIPNLLSPQLFVPAEYLNGLLPWNAAPLLKPVFHVLPVYGFDGSIGFGEFNMDHPEKFFSNLLVSNYINVPQLYVSEQKMIGNTLKLGRNFYFLSGIMYGAQLGVRGNNWGMGTREGILYRPSENLSIAFWSQYFQSVAVYSPVLFPRLDGDMAAIRMPATPEVYSFGVQASFVVGEFIVGVGMSVAPVPFQDRQHSEFRYR